MSDDDLGPKCELFEAKLTICINKHLERIERQSVF